MKKKLTMPVTCAQVALIVGCVAAIADADDPPQSPWTLKFVENPRLPRPFRQFTVKRPDGSRMRAYLANFNGRLNDRKPLAVFLDGSGAQSHFSARGGRVGCGLFGVFAESAQEQFHVAAVDKRGVAFTESHSGRGENTSEEYTRYATYDHRVAETRLLLDALLKQPAIDSRRVLLVGHSEGADVAAGVAAIDPRVTHVAFLSGGGPTQMFDLIVLCRKTMRKAGRTPAEIEKAVQDLENHYRAILADPQSTTEFFRGHAYRRWSTFFMHAPADNLLKTRAKLFVAHGTEDESGPIESFDFLVVELLRAKREDVVIRRYPNRDHGLRDVDRSPDGPPMTDVFAEIVRWAGGRPPE